MSKQRKQHPVSPAMYSHGLQLDQLDALERSIGVIAAHGDVLSIVDATQLAPGTVAVIGEEIHDHARAIRDILDQVEAQQLARPNRRCRVEEARAPYQVAPVRLPLAHRHARRLVRGSFAPTCSHRHAVLWKLHR